MAETEQTNIEQIKKQRLGTAGGQALIEGIMMNGPKGAALAVRKSDGSILVKPKNFKRLKDKNKFFNIPIIRGVVNFVESMVLGYKCLMESAELSGSFETDMKEEDMSKLDKWVDKHFGPKMMAVLSVISAILGFVIAFGLFVYLPAFLIKTIDNGLFNSFLAGHSLRPLFEGIIRIIIFVAYLAVVSQMKDIKRVFMYHGAEHKTIFCYEAGEELTVENVKKYKRFHPRCGTSFIFIVLIISILFSSILAVILNQFDGGKQVIDTAWAWSLIKILILPFVMGIGYEYIRYAGRHENVCTKIFSAPGLWLQRITTKEPDDSMIEVGIASIEAAAMGIYPEGQGEDEEEKAETTEKEIKTDESQTEDGQSEENNAGKEIKENDKADGETDAS